MLLQRIDDRSDIGIDRPHINSGFGDITKA